MTFAFNIVDGENLVALSRDLLAICGPDASMRQVNASWSEQLGHTREALLSRPIFAFVHPEDRGELIEKLNRMLSDTDRADGFTRLVTTNGACVACSWRGRSSKRTQQLYLAFTPAGSAPDIDRWLRTISTESHEWLLCLDESGRIHLSAGGSQTLVGAPPEAAVGATLLELVADEDCERVARALKQAVRREGEPQELAYRHNHSNGGGVPVLAAITSRLLDAAVGRVVVILRRPNSPQQRDTAEWRERFALAAQGTTDGIWEWDLVAGSCFYSPRWKEILGLQDDAVSDKPEEWLDRVHPADRDRLNESLTHYFEGRTPHLEIEHRIRHKNGQYLWVRCRGKALRQNGGNVSLLAGSLADMNERMVYDPLTHLPNRTLFIDRLQRVIEQKSAHPNYLYAVLLVDVDRFKNVNDSMGHHIGDELLVQLSQRLTSCVKARDMVARFAGDEFIILLDDVAKQSEASEIAKRIQEKIMWPFSLNDQEVYITSSIGITLGTRQYKTPSEILRDADIALHRSKEQGKARHEFFSTGMFQFAIARMRIENDLRKVIDRGEIQLNYQPIVDLASGTLNGFEALVRWHHPEIGMISPGEFIPVAEEMGAIIEIGRFALRTACEQMVEWLRTQGPYAPKMISVNLSSRQFADPDLVASIETIVQQAGLDPGCLKLEITESALIENNDVATEVLAQLQRLGIRLALDDFGTGYSSLAYLHRFPVSYLKIDRSFVRRISGQVGRDAIVQTIVTLAHNLQMQVIAEGIETAEQLIALRSIDCHYGQGYYFGKPMTAERATALIQENRVW